MNVIASFVLDRQYIERLDRMAAARMRCENKHMLTCKLISALSFLQIQTVFGRR